MNLVPAYIVRFDGHVCAAVTSGLSRHPLLLRKQKNEAPAVFTDPLDECARLSAIRAIRATKRTRWNLANPQYAEFRQTASGKRLMCWKGSTRRGKRWKICPLAEGAK